MNEKVLPAIDKITAREAAIIAAHALIGWALCGAIMWVGMAVTSMETTLIAHAIGAPIVFGVISWYYFRHFGFTSPLATAGLFLGFVIFMDFFLVGLLINQSLEMFTSVLGTWLPFFLLSSATYLVGTTFKSKA